jgi:hypothetical protein
MPSKAKPTTALVLDQPQQQDNESLSSDELEDAITSPQVPRRPRRLTQTSRLELDPTSESSDEADGRLTDTESELGRDRHRIGTPLISGVTPAYATITDHPQITALQSLREIEEHDRDDRQIHGIETQFRAVLATDHDQNSDGGDSPDPNTVAALSAIQIQGRPLLGTCGAVGIEQKAD